MIKRTRGDTWTITGQVASNGTPVDLTGAAVTAQLRETPDATTGHAFTATVTDAAAGQVSLVLADSVTATLAPMVHVYDVQVLSGGVTTTYGVGSQVKVTADTTRPA